MHRFPEIAQSLAAQHPLHDHIDIAEVEQNLISHENQLEFDPAELDNDAFRSQVAQAIDRTLIMKGVTEERHAPVQFEVKVTRAISAVALSLHPMRSYRRAGLSSPPQLARVSAAIAETLSMQSARLPGLRVDKLNQMAAAVVFKEFIPQIACSSAPLEELTDGQILALAHKAFNAKGARIRRDVQV